MTTIAIAIVSALAAFRLAVWMFGYVINDRERRGDGWVSRRYIIRLDRNYRRSLEVGLNVMGSHRTLALEVSRGGDAGQDMSLRVALYFASAYVSLRGFLGFADTGCFGVTTGFSYYDDLLNIRWRCDDSETRHVNGRSIPRLGWYRSWFVRDVLFGPAKYTKGQGTPVLVAIQMPERSYTASVKIAEDRWKRPRWPFALRVSRANVDIPEGIPTPGKGENSYDCGEDATYGMTCPAKTVTEAVEAVRESVFRQRRRYGGGNWLPEAYRDANVDSTR